MARQAKRANVWAIGVAAVAVGWVVLFFSGKGILVGSKEKGEGLATTMTCTYFTGGGFETIDLLKLNVGVLGAQVCPRTIDVD